MAAFDKVKQFSNDVQAELRKVTWPDRQEVINSTTIVIITISVVALLLWIVDLSLQRVMGIILR